jgi:hypothetical protein
MKETAGDTLCYRMSAIGDVVAVAHTNITFYGIGTVSIQEISCFGVC